MFDVRISVTREEYCSDLFTSVLYTFLGNAGVYLFENDIERRSREFISRGEIEESRISLIVFTTDCADSTLFLSELEKIMECRRTVGQQIVPVFYYVDPSEVRKQTGDVGEAFPSIDRKSANDENKVLSYSTALQEAARISPRFVTHWDTDEDIKNIVEHVTSLLDSTDLFVAEHPVGVQSRVQKVIQILNYHKSDDVLLLGIWGMGGIGKTTIAKAIYNQISYNFELRKFLPDLRYRSISLRQHLFSFAFSTTPKNFTPAAGDDLETYLSGKRSFFVFDNVNDFDHLNELLGLREWYGPGSRIIVTTRNREVLRSLRVDHIYRVDEMDFNECVELFSWYAFQKATPERNFAGLIKHVVEYSDGLPLALVALGSTLFERNTEDWESVLDRLKRFPIQDIQEVLKISFDDLAHKEQRIFLELANLSYFFVGMDRNDIIQIFKSSGYVAARSGIELLEPLENQSLVTFDENKKLCMHPLLQDLGRAIYQKQSSVKPQILTETLDDEESIELFSWHAFKEPCPRNEFAQLSSKVISYCGRLPLALEVIGSHLFNRGVEEWMSVLKKLKSIPDKQVQKKLKISFDGLSEDEYREIFLDIAFFFIGMEKVDAMNILGGCGYSTTIGINVLIERCLVYVDTKDKLRMHDLLRDMGREIIREISPKAPEKRSRVWHPEEGTKAIEGLALKLSRMNPIHLKTRAFKNMKRLKLLQLDGVYLDGDFKYLSTKLRLLCWHGCPSRYTTANFDQGNLVAINLKHSNLQLVWKKGQLMEMLKVLNLSHSKHLTRTPDFSCLPNLEKLILKYCLNLSSISHTIGDLKQVLLINLKGCTSLRILPRSIYQLKSLKTLIISGCSNLDNLEEDLEQMESLTTFKADGTAITQVPKALIRLKSIRYISLCGFEGFSRNVIPSIIWSWTSPTNNLSPQIPAFVELSRLGSITVSKRSFHSTSSSTIDELPQFPKRLRLEDGSQIQKTTDVALFDIRNFKEQETTLTASHVSDMDTSVICLDSCSQGEITGSKNPFGSILIQMGMNCPVTEKLRESISKFSGSGNALGECLLPDDNDPDWSTFSSEGFSMFFDVPQVNGRILKAVMLCIVYFSSRDIITSKGLVLSNVSIINHTKATTDVYKGDTFTSLRYEDWQSVISNLEPGDKVQVVAVLEHGFIVKKTAVYLIYEEPVDQSMDHCHADVFVSRSNTTVSGGDDGVAVDMNENASGVDGMAVSESVTASSVDNMIADMNKNTSSVEAVVADGNAVVSDMPADNNDDIISGGDENRFC